MCAHVKYVAATIVRNTIRKVYYYNILLRRLFLRFTNGVQMSNALITNYNTLLQN